MARTRRGARRTRSVDKVSAERPVPSQLCVWYEENVGPGDEDFGQYLYALKATQPSDRQLVWEGGSERGIIGVVDFDSTSVLAHGLYYAFGNVTWLDEPVTRAKIARDPLLRERFLGQGRTFLQGRPKRLSSEVVTAIEKLGGGWPPADLPTGDPINEPFEV